MNLNTNEDILRALRAQAWERAKGELRAVAVTFFGNASAEPGQFDDYTAEVDKFIREVENRGLAE